MTRFFILIALFAVTSLTLLGGQNRAALSPAQGSTTPQAVTVYVTKTGNKYHRLGCRYLRNGGSPMALKDAKAKGYTPCKVCSPPR
jgi:competence protein ComEC